MTPELSEPLEAAAPQTDDADPGQILARMLANKKIKLASPEDVALLEKERMDGLASDLLVRAHCPPRALRFILGHPSWFSQPPGVAEKRAGLDQCLSRPGGATVAIYGPQGVGKTVLAVDSIVRQTGRQKSAKYVLAPMLLAELLDAKSEGKLARELREWSQVGLLVIDQYDKLAATDYETRWLFDLLDTRHNAEGYTILIANADTTGLGKLLGPSIVQRTQEAGGCFECNWPRVRPNN